MSAELVKHTGGCHCGKVRFEVLAKPELTAYDCKYVFTRFYWPVLVVRSYKVRGAATHTNYSG